MSEDPVTEVSFWEQTIISGLNFFFKFASHAKIIVLSILAP